MSDTITVTGNVATDPERKQVSGGVTLTSFRVASSQRRIDKNTGQWVDGATNFYSVSVFRRLGENAYLSLRKGERVVVQGKLKVRDWDTGAKSGTDVEIEADAIGHDLLFGTSTFHKGGAGRGEAGGASDGWAAPGVESGHTVTDASEARPTEWPVADVGELAGVGASAGSGDESGGADTPDRPF